MTATEAIRKLKEYGKLSDEQAESIVDVIETWHAERAVTRDHLDARLAELRTWMEGRLRTLAWQIVLSLGALIVGSVWLNHLWK